MEDLQSTVRGGEGWPRPRHTLLNMLDQETPFHAPPDACCFLPKSSCVYILHPQLCCDLLEDLIIFEVSLLLVPCWTQSTHLVTEKQITNLPCRLPASSFFSEL